MNTYSARSPKGPIRAQTYKEHVMGVLSKAHLYALSASTYSTLDGALLLEMVDIASAYHDLGKLVQENQVVLHEERKKRSLPVNHVDAGTAHLVSDSCCSVLAAVAVSSHHIGLPNFIHEQNRGEAAFRDDEIIKRTDRELSKLIEIHDSIISDKIGSENELPKGDLSIFLRILLSCVVDADHTDSAINDGDYPISKPEAPLRPKERLVQLDAYVSALPGDDERSRLCAEMYNSCRDARIKENIVSCSSPVGSGKTTAIMANLLSQAEKRGLRRIFVVLPFTNIIKQSVKIYREALVLPGENPEEIVAELHHRADFENDDIRYLTALWRAPIIVTTAVTFFETLASKGTSGLRRLHEFPGSAIFLDEAHAALPAELLPIAWHWMKIYAKEWSCYWVLASGSLNRFWDIDKISSEKINVPEIVDEKLRSTLNNYEKARISYRHDLRPKSIDEFFDWIVKFQGPRLVILNTVQSAAILAEYFCQKCGREYVEHLSTALTPMDREKALLRVKSRLECKEDSDWTLFATSCVEAGVDLSFRNGFRELAALTSLLQIAGRVDRKGFFGDSEVWTFCLLEDERLKANPSVKNAAAVLKDFLLNGTEIDPILTTSAIDKELRKYGIDSLSRKLIDKEKVRDFPFVDENFKVIKSTTKLAVINEEILKSIAVGCFTWQELQTNSVQIAEYKLREMRASQIATGIYKWNFGYDNFIGYMRGIIDNKAFLEGVLII